MSEAIDFSQAQLVSRADEANPEEFYSQKPELSVVEGASPEVRHMFMLLHDGNSRVIDYRGCEENGGQPRRYIDPRFVARPALRVVD